MSSEFKKISSSLCSTLHVGTGMTLGRKLLPNFTGELVLSLNHELYLLQIIAKIWLICIKAQCLTE